MRTTTSRTGGAPRRIVIGAVVAAAVVVIALLVAVSASGGGDATTPATVDAAAVAAARAAVAGVPQKGQVLGRASAPVEIDEVADLQCPFCAEAASTAVPRIVSRYVRPGVARLRFVPLAFISADSERGALAALAAGDQGRLWQFVELSYRLQGPERSGWLDDAFVRDAAGALGLDVPALDAARAAPAARTALGAAASEAAAAGVTSTPTFVVKGPHGTRIVTGVPQGHAMDEAIAAVR